MATMSKSEIKELSSVERELSIVILGDGIKSEMDRAYQRLSGQVKLKGFRQGKVPRPLLEQYYKADVEKDVLNRLLTKSYQEAIQTHAIIPVADPQIKADQPFLPGTDFAYSAKVEIRPSVVLKAYEGLTLSVPNFSITDADIDAQLERLRDAHATIAQVTDRDSIVQGDLVECSYSGTVDGAHSKALSRMNHTIEVGSGTFFAQVEQALIGKKVGDKIDVTLTVPESFENEALHGKEAHLSVVVSAIRCKQKPALDDEFAKDVSDQFNTLADLRAAISTNLDAQRVMREGEAKREAAIAALIQQNPFDVPPSLIQRQAEQQAMQPLMYMAKEQAQSIWQEHGARLTEEARPQALKTIQATFICDAIAQAQNIEVSQSEVDAELAAEAKRANVTVQKMRSYYKADDLDGLRRRLAAGKALASVIEKAQIKVMDSAQNG